MNQEYDVNLRINDERIPLNPYVKSVFIKVLLALVSTLKKIPEEIAKIEITIKR